MANKPTEENKTNNGEQNAPDKTAKTEKKKTVRVICEGVLGPLGLRKGDTTDNEDYVALLKTKRGKTLVEEVK